MDTRIKDSLGLIAIALVGSVVLALIETGVIH